MIYDSIDAMIALYLRNKLKSVQKKTDKFIYTKYNKE